MALSETAVRSINASETGEVWLVLLTIDEASFDQPIRVVNAGADIISRLQTYVDTPVGVALPSQGTESPPRVELTLDAIDQTMARAFEAATPPVSCTLEVVLASDPDTVELGPIPLQVYHVNWDAMTVTGDLGFERLLDAPYPAHTISPADYPGVF